MTREQLEKYHDITVRLKMLTSTIVTDAVVGSSSDYPYTSHPVTLHGVRGDVKTLAEVESLTRQKEAIDGYIDGLEDVRMKTITEMRIKKNFSWVQIGRRMNEPPDTVRMRFNRALEK